MPRVEPKEGKSLIASWSRGEPIQGRREIFAGIFLDVGVDPALDTAAARAGWAQGKLRHKDGEAREHYLLKTPTLVYVMIAGVPFKTVGALAQHPAEAAQVGIACRWRSEIGERSVLAVHLLFADLVPHGFLTPIPLVVRSNHTDDLLAALVAHNTVLDRAETAMQRSFEFYQVALPIDAGEGVARGSSAAPETTSSVMPITCVHPAQLTRKYITEMTAPIEVSTTALEWEAEIQRYVVNFLDRQPLGQRR